MLRVDTSGTDASNRVTVDGDCDGDGIYATLDGDDAVGIGVRTAIVGTSQTTWTHVTRLNLTRFINKSIVTYNATSDYSLDAHQIWDYLNITDNGDGGSGDNCFDSRGRYIELSHSNISGCDEDGVYHQGKYFLSDYLVVGDVSRANTNGDGLQLAQEADGYVVRHMECDHTAVDSKQCFIVSVLSDTGAFGLFADSVLYCKPGAAVQNCAFVTGVNAVMRGVFTSGGNYGIAIEDSADSNGTRVEGSISVGATDTGINVAGTNPTGITLSNVDAVGAGSRGISVTTTNPVTIQNSIAANNAGCGINRGHASQVEQYNDSHGNGTAFCVAGVSASAGTGSMTSDPSFSGGASPTSAEGFCLTPDSPLLAAGTYLGAWATGYDGEDLGKPPVIGARGLCRSRQPAGVRPAASRTVH